MVVETKRGTGLRLTTTPEETWHIKQEGFDPYLEHDMETLFAVGNGYLGIRGTGELGGRYSRPGMFVAGLFAPDAQNSLPQLVVCPNPFTIDFSVEGAPVVPDEHLPEEHQRLLDLKQALLAREWVISNGEGRRTAFKSIRGALQNHRHATFQYLEVKPLNYSAEVSIGFSVPSYSSNLGGVRHLDFQGSGEAAGGGLINEYEYDGGENGGRRRLAIASRTTPLFSGDTGLSLSLETDVEASAETEASHAAAAPDSSDPADPVVGPSPSQRYTWEASIGQTYAFWRVVTVATTREAETPSDFATDLLHQLASQPPDELVAGHLACWDKLWSTSDVILDGDPQIQQALRFYEYHLLIAANPEDNGASIGARTLSGEGYNGHVFWDTETFMFPFFVATQPKMARTLMMYRYQTLDGARRKAKSHGYRGAFYAWESAATGDEATPDKIYLPGEDKVIYIHTGHLQIHISADVAHAVRRYWHATGDAEFMRTAGVEILLETARFWRSRATEGPDGRFHIENLQGPDEYHVHISDNAYTNYMASWNVLRALETLEWMNAKFPEDAKELLKRIDLREDELDELRAFPAQIYFPGDPDAPAIEQFRGFFELRNVTVAELGRKEEPLSSHLDPDFLQESQILKQPDTLLLFQLFPELATKIGFQRNFDYYEPRTDHGSSLSYPTHAQLSARLGYAEMALKYLRLTAGLDLNNVMGNAALGIHAATAGGLWQAVVFGFMGLQYTDEGITMDPRLPDSWTRVSFCAYHRGQLFDITVNNRPVSWEIRTRES